MGTWGVRVSDSAGVAAGMAGLAARATGRGVADARVRRAGRRPSLPLLVPLTFALLVVTNFVSFSIFGFTFRGWAWVILLSVSLFRLSTHVRKVQLPLRIWAPWCAMVFAYTFAGYEDALQSTAQILCPVIVAAAVSTYAFDVGSLRKLDRVIRTSYWMLLVGVVFIVIPFSLADIENSGWASGAISLLFFQSWFLASYFLNGRKKLDLVLYVSAVAVPLIGANRGPMLAGAALAVCAILPIRIGPRLATATVAVALSILAFYSPKVQKKMFFSGHGSVRDLRSDNADVRTSGRKEMWKALEAGAADRPLWGHGGNAESTYLREAGFQTNRVHNDWLRIRFNYGLVGVLVYACTLIAQTLHARRYLAATNPTLRTIAAAGLSCFVPYAVVMYTDNVLIYCQYFTVPMLILVGVVYSARILRPSAVRRTVLARRPDFARSFAR